MAQSDGAAATGRKGRRGVDTPAKGESPTFAVVLQRYRGAAGLTQEALAERAGLSARGISDLERGISRTHRPDTVQRLAGALGLSARERHLLEQAARGDPHLSPSPRATAPAPPPDALPPFIGRGRERALLERHLSAQGPPVLLVAGEPGIGKSRLLHEAVARAAGQGWTVLVGGCQRRGGQGLYAPLLGALQRHLQDQSPLELRPALRGCAWLVRLLPELAEGPIEPLPAWTLPPEQERRLMVEALGRYLANVAGPAGTLLLLDDLHWADPDALDLVEALIRSGSNPELRVLGAYRDTEALATGPLAALLADLGRADLLTQHRVTALPTAEAEELLAVLLEMREMALDPDGALRERLLQRAGGVPFFLISSVRGLRGGVGPAEVPGDLAQSVRQRVAALPPAARTVLGVAAVAGRQVDGTLLLTTAAAPEEEVLAALEATCRAQVLEDAGAQGYRFVHDVIREVVEADLGSARRTVLHRRIAEVLEAEPGAHPANVLAYHYVRGGVPDKAVHYLEQAGDQARAQYAHAAAEGYYRELVGRLDSLGRSREAALVREKLGAVLDTAGQYDTALAALEQAATTYQGAGEQEGVYRVLAALGHVHRRRGTLEEGVQRLQSVLEAHVGVEPSPGVAALYEALAALCFVSGRYAEGLVAAEQALVLARAVGAEQIAVAALYVRGCALTDLGRRAEALPVLEEAGRMAEARGYLYTACQALNMAGCVHEDLGAFATARRYTARALAIAEQRGDPTYIAYLTVRRGTGAFFSGDWAAARADYERALALCRRMGPSHASPYPLLDLGRLCLAEGDGEAAARHLEESCAISMNSGELTGLRWGQVELAEHDLLMGRPEAARVRLEPLLDRPGLEEGQVIFLLPTLAQAHLALGAVEQAAALVAQGVRRARAQPNQRALVGALRVQALILTQQAAWAAAEQALEEGLELTRGMPYPYAEARLLHVYGAMHQAEGKPGQARERLEEALAIFRRLGAHKDAERVAQAMADLVPDA
jgi:tetratricopeptide (TPR) repeat protein/transcriptional regulator with XRE-family HTH domain